MIRITVAHFSSSASRCWLPGSNTGIPACVGLLAMFLFPACAQRISDFSTPFPTKPGDTVVIGFLGGIEKWNDPQRGVRKVALHLGVAPGVYADTIENRRRMKAVALILRALDWNQNGKIDAEERAGARIVLYGQSLGGDAAIHVARRLNEMHIRVLLTVQVDSVGIDDAVIPPNVGAAANFYQHDLFTIQGRRMIRAADPAHTTILGNFKLEYKNKEANAPSTTWVRRKLGGSHAKMELDPTVWARVEKLILEAISKP